MTDTDDTTDILVIDDDDLTAELVERALRNEPGHFRIVTAHDGFEGLEKLRSSSPGAAKRPMVVLLDLNMPRMSGLEPSCTMRQLK